MRIIVHHYDDGTRYAYATAQDGATTRNIEGNRKPGARIRAAIEVECDDNVDGYRAALGDLDLVTKEIPAPG